MSHVQLRWLAPVLVWVGLSCNIYAVDGIVLIDQNRALAGNVTPGDGPGFPVTISRSGSYRLSGNLTVSGANTTAIQITADEVTIDLNGFSIVGPTICGGSPVSCSPTGTGIGVDGQSQRNVTVVNGTVRGMGNIGVAVSSGGYVAKVHAHSNGSSGIMAFQSVVTGNTTTVNGHRGIFIYNSVASGNMVMNNIIGIEIGCPSTVVGNTVSSNDLNLDIPGSSAGCALANNATP